MLGLSGPGPPPPPPPSALMVPGPSSAPSTSYCVTNHLGPTSIPSSDTLLLTLRSKPHSRVFRALFQYLPMRDSPNENPQLELTLQPGDVILVKGEMDSDGFYRGETLDGRNGLVPSNYVERVPDSILLANARAPSPSFPLRIPQHLSTIAHDFSSPDHSTLPDSVCPYPPADVTKVTVQEIKNNETPRIPCPRELTVEKKLSRSALVSWSPPEESFVAVSQYHVCLDGAVRAIVPGSYKCRALVEDIPLEGSVNLSVRAVTEHGHSPDACCTIAIGNEAAVAPQQVRVWAVTPVSACVRWYPSNSNAEHVVSLNAVKVGVCPPTVFQVQLQGLQPSTIYRVSVRTKHPKAVLEQRPVERCIDFKTLPKIGLPDPPSHVQVEVGPQPGTLLVSWQPVVNQPKPPSRAAVHSYLIYADGKNIAQVPSESADHVVLRLADLSDDPPIFITVRTKTKEGAVSSDSNVARVPRTAAGLASHQDHNLIPTLQTVPTLPQLPSVPTIPNQIDMTSSYPSYGHNQVANQAMFGVPMGSTGTLGGASMTNGHMAPMVAPMSMPYTAPARMVGATGLMAYQQPSYPNAAAALIQPATASASNSAYATFDRSASLGAQGTSAPHNSILLGASTARPSPSNIQASLPNAWKPSQMSQYYTFHPNFLHTEPTNAEDNRPSVLEMENSYLLRHRQNDWANAPDARARIEAYARGLARTGSADERIHPGIPIARQRLIAPRLARVKSESVFGTRSEPDLRPPTLDGDQDCRWFVALFDYTHQMSPNTNAETDELSFRKHQLIQVFGDIDADGFYQGQIGERVGLVPSNMVIEIAKEDVFLRRYAAMAGSSAPIAAPAEPALRRMRWGSLKSRSYDHAGDRAASQHRAHQNYASLDRRDDRDRLPPEARYRRMAGVGGGARLEYDYRRDKEYDDRYGSRDRAGRRQLEPRNEYANPAYDEDGYRERDRRIDRDRERERDRDRERERERDRDRDRDRDRYDRDRRDRADRGGYDDRRRDDRFRDPYGPGPSNSGGGSMPGPSGLGPGPAPRDEYRDKYRERGQGGTDYQGAGPSSSYDYQPSTSQGPSSMAQMNHQMGQMQIGGGMGMGTSNQAMHPNNHNHMQQQYPSQMQQQLPQQPQQQQQLIGIPSSSGIGGMGGAGMSSGGQMMNEQMYNGMNMKKMVAKFDYDSRQLSPNVDAEQVELSFRQGDIITVLGEMDEDGFYMGELNGNRGLVPSNFLQQSPLNTLGPSQPTEPMRKGVAFSDTTAVRKTAPVRQTSQTSATVSAGAGIAKPAAKKSTAGQAAGKPLTKKTSDVGKGAAPNARKTSTAVKKSDSTAKKKS